MPRPRNLKNKNRWYLPKTDPYFHHGYIFKRNEQAYIFMNQNEFNPVAKKINTKVPFYPKNKDFALRILRDALIDWTTRKKHNNMTVTDLFEVYRKFNFPKLKKVTKQKHTTVFFYFIPNSDRILASDYERVREEILKVKAETPKKNNTIRKELQIVRQIFNFGINEEYIEKNPVLLSMFPKEEKVNLPVYSVEEIGKLIKHFQGTGNREMELLIRFIRITGTRIQETITISTEQVLADRIVIYGKGDKDRYIPMNIEGFRELKEITAELINMSRNGRLFSWNYPGTPQKNIKLAAEKLKIYEPQKAFHSIRRFRENELIHNEEVKDRYVAQLLGHSKQIQEKHYIKELGFEKFAEKLETGIVNGKKKKVETKEKGQN